MIYKISLCFVVYLFLCFVLQTIESMTVIPRRANVTYLNPKYMSWGMCNIRRYSRKSPYYINISGNTKHTWNNNVTVHILIKQLLTNVYRHSFVEFHYKMCDLINEEPFMGGMVKQAGVTCPLPSGDHYYKNMTVLTQNFPNVFPFEKGRADVTLEVTKTAEVIAQFFVEVEFLQKLVKH